MIRVIAVHVALFLVPFLAYALVLVARRRPVGEARTWAEAPLTLLALAGAAFVAAGLIGLASFSTGGRDGTYVPSTYVDGKLVPGHID